MHEASICASLTDPLATEKSRTIYAYQTITAPQEYANLDFQHKIASVISASAKKIRKGKVSNEELAKQWHISLEAARKTLERTTQQAVRDFTNDTGT